MKTTQTLGTDKAQSALSRISVALDIPASRVLERLLESSSPEMLVELIEGGRSLSGVRLVVLDVPEQLAVMDSIAIGLRGLSKRVADAARKGAIDGVMESQKGGK